MARPSPLLLLVLVCALAEFACAWTEVPLNAAAAPLREMTNAQRLAQGLPPKKPRYRRAGENRLKPSGFVPAPAATSSAAVAPPPAPSSTPACPEATGTITVASADGSLAGFVSAPNEEGLYGYTTNASEAAKFTYSTCAPIPFDITGETTEAENTAYELLGGVQDSRTGCFLVGNVPQTTSLQNLPNPLASVLGLASS
ncbi:hypothetical protein PsYK624_106870 [Phanerochaete sordida]|uniref:Uncharacterized protein n=1 Tax=Phanerochaete sordida TaxID=48140 RepID=A0A9P3GGI9_9APHY|nr:hypothetical protein PsYK624_106870 [Phanerochaete sordida]